MATGTVTITEQRHTSMKKITFDYTTTAGGAAGDTTTYTYDGAIDRVVIYHGTGGTALDTGYSVALNDADGYDILDGGGGAIVTANGTLQFQGNIGLSAVAGSDITLAVTSGGDSNVGAVEIYIR